MFVGCLKFNCNLGNWDVSNVKSMEGMFKECSNFKGKGLDKWKVDNVEDMYVMFRYCETFDCDLSQWNVSKVIDMEGMFDGCYSLKNIPGWYR